MNTPSDGAYAHEDAQMQNERSQRERDNILFHIGELKGDNKALFAALAAVQAQLVGFRDEVLARAEKTEDRLSEKLEKVDRKHGACNEELDSRIRKLENGWIKLGAFGFVAAAAASLLANPAWRLIGSIASEATK